MGTPDGSDNPLSGLVSTGYRRKHPCLTRRLQVVARQVVFLDGLLRGLHQAATGLDALDGTVQLALDVWLVEVGNRRELGLGNICRNRPTVFSTRVDDADII